LPGIVSGSGIGDPLGPLKTEHSAGQTPTAEFIFWYIFLSLSSSLFIPSVGKEVRKLLISFYGGRSSPWTLIQSRFRAILMKINMPDVGVVAYDFDFCRHFRFGLATNDMLKNNTWGYQIYIVIGICYLKNVIYSDYKTKIV